MAVDREEIRRLCRDDPDAVIAIIERQDARITELEAQVAELKALVAVLEARLNQNSRNSSRPPSTDVFIKPRSLRRKGERPVGGQSGHKGSTLKMTGCPDQVVDHKVTVCEGCRSCLEQVPVLDVERRQVFEIPPIRIMVTEHRAERKQCPCCGKITRARFPAGVDSPVQYGDFLRAFVTYLHVFQYVPYDRISVFFRDVFGHSISNASLTRMVKLCYDELILFEDLVRYWLTWYGHHRNRGNKATDSLGVLPFYKGTMVHDFWKPYFRYDCRHALCNAHLVRELRGITETYGHTWSKQLDGLLHEIKDAVDACPGRGLDKEQLDGFEQRYMEIITLGTRENPESESVRVGRAGPKTQTKAKNLLDRCKNYREETLRFMYDLQVPFDNNQAERDIRMMKVQQKISGSFRSDKGATCYCRVRAYISTLRKNNQPILASIVKAFQGRPYVPLPTH
jgi:transposase